MRRVRAGLAVVALAFAMTACAASSPPAPVTACPSWTWFETPADAAHDSTSVVLARVLRRDGTDEALSAQMPAWRVHVEEWVKGAGADEERVVSTVDACGDRTDPFDAVGDGAVYLFLTDVDGALRTLTPLQGSVAPAPDGSLPSSWPVP